MTSNCNIFLLSEITELMRFFPDSQRVLFINNNPNEIGNVKWTPYIHLEKLITALDPLLTINYI